MKKADREKRKAEEFIEKLIAGAKRIQDMPEEERPKGCVRGSNE